MRHFLDIKDFDKERLSALLDTAHDMNLVTMWGGRLRVFTSA